MSPSVECADITGPPEKHILPWSDLGWPCNHGGSVAVTAMTADGHGVNCMVWYYLGHPLDGLMNDAAERRATYDAAIAECQRSQPRIFSVSSTQQVDLSALALCVHETYHFEETQRDTWDGVVHEYKEKCNLRGVAVIPIFPPRSVRDLEYYGLDAEGGHILLQVTEVPSTNPNVPFLALQYVGFRDLLRVAE